MLVKTYKKAGSTISAAIQRFATAGLGWLHTSREWLIVLAATGIGIALAMGLASPAAYDQAVSIAGISFYFLFIVIDPLIGLVMWMISQPLLDIPLQIELGKGIPNLDLSRLCLIWITVILLGRLTIRYYRLQPINKFEVVLLLFLIGMTQAGFRGRLGIRSVHTIFSWYWLPALTYFAVKHLVSDQRSQRLVLAAVVFIGLYSAVYAFYEVTTGQVLFTSGRDFGHLEYKSGLRVLRGIWGGNMQFGRVFNIALPLLFYFFLKTRSPSKKMLYTVGLALLFGALLITYKRTAWMSMVAIMFVLQLFYSQFRRLFVIILLVVGIAVAFNWDGITSSDAYSRAQGKDASKVEGRTEAWGHSQEFFLERPLWGHGFQQYRFLAARRGYNDVDIENEYFAILVSAGVSGFLPYIGLLLILFYDGLQHYRGRVPNSLADRALVAVFWSILVGYLGSLMAGNMEHLLIRSMIYALAAAILYARSESASAPVRLEQRSVEFASSVS